MDADLIGRTLDGRFAIEAKLAAGGYGTVYRARWIQPGRSDLPVAIKIMHPHLCADPSVVVRFRREAAALSRLASRHTVHTYEAGEDRATGAQFLVMELLDGESLHYRFGRSGPLPWRTALSIIRQVCESLAETHALGIVHRDLKPSNIFLVRKPAQDFVKVIDLGIAKFAEHSRIADRAKLTQLGHSVGTPEYMSPEQILGRAVDGRSDLYTLGVVIYELIAGARPFPDKTLPSLITAIATKSPPPLSTRARWPIPRSLDELIRRCLEREPKHRFGNVKQLAHAIDQVLDERHDKTTLRQWGQGGVFGEDEDEHTLVARSPERERSSERLTARGGLLEARASFDPHREAAIRTPLVDTEKLRWQIEGTGVPFGQALPPNRLAMGSSPRIDQRAVVRRRAYGLIAAKILGALIVLALVGLAIGTILATFAS